MILAYRQSRCWLLGGFFEESVTLGLMHTLTVWRSMLATREIWLKKCGRIASVLCLSFLSDYVFQFFFVFFRGQYARYFHNIMHQA